MSNYSMDTSKGRPSPYYSFLRRAFRPVPSENDDPGRFDNIIESMQVPASSTTGQLRVLDLGCGDCLLLRKFLSIHEKDGHLTHLGGTAKFSYFAVDRALTPNGPEWRAIVDACGRHGCCFETPLPGPFDFLEARMLERELSQHGPFNFILLSNVLHELPPRFLPDLFMTLSRCLDSNGRLVILDPDAKWCLSPEAWAPDAKTKGLLPLIEWEAEAVWFCSGAIVSALRAVGFAEVVAVPAERERATLWQIVATHPDRSKPHATTIVEVRDELSRHLEKELESQLASYSSLRLELAKAIEAHNELKGGLRLKAMEFFGTCASHTRRYEAWKELK